MSMTAPETPREITRRLDATMQIGADEESAAKLLPHLRWELGELMRRVGPEDLEPTELLGILGILAGVHSRILGRPLGGARRPALWVVPPT